MSVNFCVMVLTRELLIGVKRMLAIVVKRVYCYYGLSLIVMKSVLSDCYA